MALRRSSILSTFYIAFRTLFQYFIMSVSSREDTSSAPTSPEMRLAVPSRPRKTERRVAVLTSGGDSAGMNAAGMF